MGIGRESAGRQAVAVKTMSRCRTTATLPARFEPLCCVASIVIRSSFSATLPKRVFPPRSIAMVVTVTLSAITSITRYASRPTRACVSARTFPALFFAEPEEYDGGELVIQDTAGPRSVKLTAGDAVIYPARRCIRYCR